MNLQAAEFFYLLILLKIIYFRYKKKQSSDCLFCFVSRELDPHGIRKVMRSWMSSQDIPVKIAELALQHDVRSAIEKVYDKYSYVEEIREALQKWNDYIEGLLPQRFLELLTA